MKILSIMVMSLLTLFTVACGKIPEGNSLSSDSSDTVVIGSGSENAVFYPAIEAFAKSKGQKVVLQSKGSIDLANELALGKSTPHDIVWVANSSVLEGIKGHAVKDLTSIMISPVMPIVKRSKADALGWTSKSITNADFYKAVLDGKLKFSMTSASQSFSGQAAYIGMLSSISGNPEVLQSSDIDGMGVTQKVASILQKVARSSASSGTLKSFMVQNIASYDAMLNYEGLAFEANNELKAAGKTDTFCALMPVDGVVVADHSIGYVDKGDAKKAQFYQELVAYLKSPAFKSILKQNGRRGEMGLLASSEKTTYDPCWDTDRPIKQVTMPTAEVVAKAVDIYQTGLRKPSFTVYVADFSGSMEGNGETQIKKAMLTLFDANEARKWSLQATSKDVNVFIPFSSEPWKPIEVHGNNPQGYLQALKAINNLSATGGTEMYLGINKALTRISQEKNLSEYAVSIILMTDGKSDSAGYDTAISGIKQQFEKHGIAMYSVLFGSADPDQLKKIALHQVGGNQELANAYVCDGRKDLVGCFRKVRANN